MGKKPNDQGRAYEYAWMNALYQALASVRNTEIVRNMSYDANERAWSSIDPDTQARFTLSANAAVQTILELEPRTTEQDNDLLSLAFQKDDAGTKGDVRDIVIKRDSVPWEIGLSIKHNHEAIKHSRLSHRLDFGSEWFQIPCSQDYWSAIKPIFERLKSEKNTGKKWSDLPDKETAVYIPLLNAFMDEVNRANRSDPSVPKKMVEYLIGTKDYYKVVSQDAKKLTMIHSFNVHGTLNKPSRVKVSAITVPIVKLPTEIVTLRRKPDCDTTVEMYLNNGWQLSFRIHNASTKVEPSLKFDIQFVGMPCEIHEIECKWNA